MGSAQGHEFRGYYLHEDNGFNNSPSDNDYKSFGADERITRAEGSNNAVEVFEPGSRIPVDIVEQNFAGSFRVEFTYTNPWWLNFLWGAPTTSDTNNDNTTYTHTWSGEDMQSQRIFIGREGQSTERALKGCVAASVNITTPVPGMYQVVIEGAYADEEKTGSIQSQPNDGNKPMTFADTTMKLGGSTLGYIQSGSLSISNNVQLIHELGSRVAIDYSERSLVPRVNFEKINEDGKTNNLEKMYGSSGSSSVQSDVTNRESMTLIADNGKGAGSGINKLTANLTGTFPDSYAENGLNDPESDVTEQVNRAVESVSFDAKNETQNAR